MPGTYTGRVLIQASGSSNRSVTVTVNLRVTTPSPITVGAASLSFTYAIGDPAPASQTVSVASAPNGKPFEISADAGTSGWLEFSADSAQTPATITVSVMPGGLPPGSYSGPMRVTLFGSGTQAVIQVKLTVAGTISFTYQPGSDPPKAKCFAFDAPPGQGFTISTTGEQWFSVQPSQGTTPASICVSVAPQKMAPGDYSGTLAISLGPTRLTVKLKILAAPSLRISGAKSLSFVAQPAGKPIPAQVLTVTSTNPDRGAQFNISVDPPAPWLQISSQSATTPATLTITASADGVARGQRNA